MRESTIEARLKKGVERVGGLCEKWVNPGRRGAMDRIVQLPDGRTIFVETKRPEGQLSGYQRWFADEMRKRKADVRCLYSAEQVDEFLREISENGI